MIDQEKKLLKRRLEDKRGRLRRMIRRQEISGTGRLGYGNHMADDATEVFEQARNLALRRNLECLLDQVEYAVYRFKQGMYELCEHCGQMIDPARLKALPYVTLCIDCKQSSERGGKARKYHT